MQRKLKSICYFGSYLPDYSRNKILIDGLTKNNIQIHQCQSGIGSAFKRYPELIKKYWRIRHKIDLIYVGFFGHLDMPLAWILAKMTHKKLVFDMFYSMHDTYVFDRKSTQQGSFLAKMYILIDKFSASLADVVITDTRTHADYFINTLKVNQHKFRRIFVGGDDLIFCPMEKRKSKFIMIEFHGYFTRLHGAEYFIKAAKLLENEKYLKFLLIGTSTVYKEPIRLYKKLKPKTLTYIPELSPKALARTLARSDICVGHLGTTKKARSVITNKMYHGLATKIAVIAGDCEATRELLTDKKNALFVKMGDEVDLAEKIKLLAKNPKLRQNIANQGYKLYRNKLTNQLLGKQLIQIFNNLIFG